MKEQIKPNHADHISGYKEIVINKMIETENVVAQIKYDGERTLLHFDGPNIYCTSRRISKKTGEYMENQDKLPYLQEFWTKKYNFLKSNNMEFGYTVLDCECYSNDWSTIVGILHSLPERAKTLQTDGTVRYAIFDCLFFDGTDIRNLCYSDRLKCVQYVINKISYEQFHKAEQYTITSFDEIDEYKTLAVNEGYEGIVVKSLERKYYDEGASLKVKKFETLDVVVYDYQQGSGKYSNTIGALLVGYYDSVNDKIIHVSKVNCGTDEDRNMWRDNWNILKNTVIEVKCQEITSSSLRHPVYIRQRPDKSYKMCTKNTIFKDEE